MIENSPLLNGYILLEDGSIFSGKLIGSQQITFGEICFNTGMTGYQEIFTDPSYKGQILILTTPHVGNYGINQTDKESNQIQIEGLVLKNYSKHFSRNLAVTDLDSYLKSEGKTAIVDVDTRALVRYIRSKGAMNAAIFSINEDINAMKELLMKQPAMEGRDLTKEVSTKITYEVGNSYTCLHKVALIDFGVKQNIIQCLVDRNTFVKVFPSTVSFNEIADFEPNGVLLSNGPGDPAVLKHGVELTKELLENQVPIFGICLGHQILATALGMKTYKMFNGHRGINHPIFNQLSGKGEITSQNHGFAVEEDLNSQNDVTITHIHLNDNTVAGIKAKHFPAFSVQYHPESSPGPHDSSYLFDEFIELIKNKKHEWNSTHTRETNS